MRTDTAQAQAHKILKEPFPNIPAMRRCIAGLLADIKDAQEELRVCQQEAITVTAQLAQAREALAALMLENGFATGHGDSHADLCMEFSWQLKERSAQLAQAREALSEAIEIISSGLESEGDLEAGWSKSDRKWLRKARAALAQGEKR